MKNIIIICIVIVLFYFIYKYSKSLNLFEYFFDDNTDYSKKLKEYIDLIDKINIKRINQIPVYYINMNKDIDRKQYMESQLSNHFERYYRIPGVNGKLIKNKNHDIVDGIKFINEFKDNSLGEIGCTLSHLLAIKTAYDNGEEIACIIEDDVYINLLNIQDESLDDFVKSVNNNNLDWEILQLYHFESNNLSKNFIKIKDYTLHLHQKGKYPFSTVSYIINRKGMEKILSIMGNNPFYLMKYMSIYCTSDYILYDQAKTYTINPSVVIPNNTELDSTIHTNHTNKHLKSSFNILKKYENKIKENQKIPNQILFVFGFKKQTEEFLFCYYLSVYSAYIINKPDKILFYYHYDIYGEWFDKLKEISCIEFIKIDIPTHIGKKPLKKVAHIADKIRMEKLYEHGGIYMDIDTISIRPYKYLLNNETILGFESDNAICNAVMMTVPKSRFFKIWLSKYEKEFKSDGWGESSILLPYKIYSNNKDIVKVVPKETFFIPSYNETDKIFEKNNNIPNELITLHLWESFSIKYMENIKDWSWMISNSNTLYGKIMLKIHDQILIKNKENISIGPFYINNKIYNIFNPSIIKYNNNTIIVSRVSTITHCKDSDIVDKPKEIENPYKNSTILDSYLVEWRKETNEIKLLEFKNMNISKCINFNGFEDPRLFRFRNQIWLYFHFRGIVESICGHHLLICKLDDRNLIRLNLNNMKKIEKNWMPFEYNNELYIQYSFSPHTILHCNTETGECKKIYNSFFPIKKEIGGGAPSILIVWKDKSYYLGVAHYRSPYINFFYLFRSEPPFDIIAIAERFSVSTNSNIEFCSGLIIEENIVTVSIGINDCYGSLVSFSLEEIMMSMKFLN